MAKLITFGLALVCLIFSATADPIFLSSSKRINDISKSLFFDADSFNTLMNDKLLLRQTLPDNIFVLDVKVNDKKFVNNPSLLLKELASHSDVQNYFAPSSNTFSSIYVKDALSPEFSSKVLQNIQNAGDYELTQSNLKNFHADQDSNKKTLRVTSLSVSELGSLKTALDQIKGTNNLVILKFTDNSAAPQILNMMTANERLLQDTETDGPVVNGDTSAQQNAPRGSAAKITATSDAPNISPAGLTGFVISLFLLVGVYIGFQVMQGIKGPTRFYKDTLQIGKES